MNLFCWPKQNQEGQMALFSSPDFCLQSRIYVAGNLCTNSLIAPFINIPIFNVKFLAMHKVHVHAGAISSLLYGLRKYGR